MFEGEIRVEAGERVERDGFAHAELWEIGNVFGVA